MENKMEMLRYFSKYVNESGYERFELFWSTDDRAAEEEAKYRTRNDGLRLVETSRCKCIVPRKRKVISLDTKFGAIPVGRL